MTITAHQVQQTLAAAAATLALQLMVAERPGPVREFDLIERILYVADCAAAADLAGLALLVRATAPARWVH